MLVGRLATASKKNVTINKPVSRAAAQMAKLTDAKRAAVKDSVKQKMRDVKAKPNKMQTEHKA